MKLIIDVPKEFYETIKTTLPYHFNYLEEKVRQATPLEAEFEEINNPCIECGGNCCFHEECECQKIYIKKENKK